MQDGGFDVADIKTFTGSRSRDVKRTASYAVRPTQLGTSNEVGRLGAYVEPVTSSRSRSRIISPAQYVWVEGPMADSKFLRAATLDRIGDLVDDTEGVHLRDLPPSPLCSFGQ